ncbi:MAG TPA: PAS domain-containing protein [Nitrospirota bacterium]|nr:PAS domain-containing protein [Nitrospirota bacterium]
MSKRLAEGDSFVNFIIDAMPLSIFVVDEKAHIIDYNQSASSFFEMEQGKYIKMGCGHALRCIHSMEKPEGCGYAEACKDCVIRNSITAAFQGLKQFRRTHTLRVVEGDVLREYHFLVTATPFEYQDKSFLLLVLEDITEITELQDILPICASCKSIRDDKNYWHSVEKYFSEHADVTFSHGICPDCLGKLYPWHRNEPDGGTSSGPSNNN